MRISDWSSDVCSSDLPKGFARALNLFIGNGELAESDIPALYHAAAEALLTTLESPRWPEREGAWTAAQSLFRLRWPWAQLVAQRIRTPERAERWLFSKLPDWEEKPDRAQPRPISLEDEEVTERLHRLPGEGAEHGPAQRAYAGAGGAVFAPRAHPG